MGRVLRGLGSLAGLLLIMVGIPAGLVWFPGWPLPKHWPHDQATWQQWLDHPINQSSMVDAAACLVWLLWAFSMYMLLADIVARARGVVRRPRLRLAVPLHSAATSLIGTATLAVTSIAGRPTMVGSVASPPAPPVPVGAMPTSATAMSTATTGTWTATSPAVTAGDVTLLVGDHRYTYTVRRGDNLSHIAADWLGDADRWPEIYHLNRGRHFPVQGGTLTNPDLIYPGWVLTLPPDAQPPAPATPPPATHDQPGAGTSTHSRPVTPGASATPSPSPAASTPASLAPSPTGAAVSATPSTTRTSGTVATSGAAPTGTASTDIHAGQGQRGSPSVRVRLPGGWVSLPLAAAIVAAGSMVWLRRRRRYKPGALAGPVLHDADLRPLPAVVEQARRQVRRYAPELLHPPRDTLTVREAARLRRAGQPLPAPPPPEPEGPDLAGLPSRLPAGGLGLTGPGAADAARGMLVATLSAGTPNDPDARGEIVIPAATLATLLGATAVEVGSLPRLTVAADLPAALTHIEELIIARRRLVEDEDAPDVDTLRANPDHPPVPLVLLLAEVPDRPLRPRLSTALHLGHPLATGAVLLGEWPDGDTLHVEADGTIQGADEQHLAVLDAATATELLHVLREAHTGQPASHAPADPTQPPTEPQTELGRPDDRQTLPVPSPAVAVLVPRPRPPEAASVQIPDDRLRAPAQVLGTPSLYRLDHTPIDGLREVALELLVYLAVHRDGASLEDIKEAIYGDATRERAKQRLQTDVGNLRNRIRHILGITPKQRGDPVINTGGHYHLNPDLIDVDWWRVQDALAQATATTDPALREAALWRARDAFHGPLAEGAEYEWILQDQEHARRQGVIIHTQLAALLADADPQQAAQCYEAAAALDPYNEDLAQAAMRAHAATGDAEAIKDRLRALRTALDDLDEEPDDATVQLATNLIVRLRKPPTTPRSTD